MEKECSNHVLPFPISSLLSIYNLTRNILLQSFWGEERSKLDPVYHVLCNSSCRPRSSNLYKKQSSKKIPSNPSWSRCQKKLNSKEYLIEPKKVCLILNPTKITGKSYLTLEEAKNNFITFGSCFWKRNWQVKDFKKSSFWEELTRFA